MEKRLLLLAFLGCSCNAMDTIKKVQDNQQDNKLKEIVIESLDNSLEMKEISLNDIPQIHANISNNSNLSASEVLKSLWTEKYGDEKYTNHLQKGLDTLKNKKPERYELLVDKVEKRKNVANKRFLGLDIKKEDIESFKLLFEALNDVIDNNENEIKEKKQENEKQDAVIQEKNKSIGAQRKITWGMIALAALGFGTAAATVGTDIIKIFAAKC